jgi:hypothetical protein
MTRYKITSYQGDKDLGTYEAESLEAALDELARGAGFENYNQATDDDANNGAHSRADAVMVTGDDGSRLLIGLATLNGNVQWVYVRKERSKRC